MHILSILLAKYTAMKNLVEVTQDYGLYETYDDQGLAINAMHLKILHALKALPNTIRI